MGLQQQSADPTWLFQEVCCSLESRNQDVAVRLPRFVRLSDCFSSAWTPAIPLGVTQSMLRVTPKLAG